MLIEQVVRQGRQREREGESRQAGDPQVEARAGQVGGSELFFPIMDPACLDTAKERPVNSVMARTEDGMILGLAHCLKEMGWLVFPCNYDV